MEDELTLRMFLIEKRERSVSVANKPVNRTRALWLPVSQIGYSRTTAGNPGELPEYVFTLPEWLIEKNNLWDFVTNAR